MREELNFRKHFPNLPRSARIATHRGGWRPLWGLCGVAVQWNLCQLRAVIWDQRRKPCLQPLRSPQNSVSDSPPRTSRLSMSGRHCALQLGLSRNVRGPANSPSCLPVSSMANLRFAQSSKAHSSSCLRPSPYPYFFPTRFFNGQWNCVLPLGSLQSLLPLLSWFPQTAPLLGETINFSTPALTHRVLIDESRGPGPGFQLPDEVQRV